VVTSKYKDALPLYRQEALLSRFGGDLSRATLAASIVKIGDAVQPIINLLRDHLLEAELIHADETTVQVLNEPGRAAQAKIYLFAQASGTGPPIRLFGYAPGMVAKQAVTLFAGIKPGGVLICDGYKVYGGIARVHGPTHFGCQMHVRRYFVEAKVVTPTVSRAPEQIPAQFIAAIGALYVVESEARERKLEAGARRQLLEAKARPILARIETMLLAHLHAVEPNSLLGKALHCLSTQWPRLIRYVENVALPIDHNLAESAMCPFVVGRRNWLFADTVAGAHVSANLYSLVETCKVNRGDPYIYLVCLFRKLPIA
jgi:transposase